MHPAFMDIKEQFQNTSNRYYFVSATNFNLLDMHNWVNHWKDINFLDTYDQKAKHVLVPAERKHELFENLEQINLYLLKHPEVVDLLEQAAPEPQSKKHGLFLFFDALIESQCKVLNLNIDLPKNALVKHIDNKITTTELGNQAGVPSVPNALAEVRSFEALQSIAEQHQLGDKWVVQTAYGDSGKTTFFIQNKADYQAVAEQIEEEEKVKIMRAIQCVGTAIEACATQQGTYVGPLLGEMIGVPELTPYQGGWCGNELYQDNFTPSVRQEIHLKTQQLGDTLYKHGYRGYFEVDYLIDLDTQAIYLGEINPRITGISAMTNLSPFCQKTIPLFLLHLMEYAEMPIPLSASEYNQLSLSKGAEGTSSQMILKYLEHDLNIITQAPVSGVYELNDSGHLTLIEASAEPTAKQDHPNRAYLLRVLRKGDYAYKGADLAIVFLNQVLMGEQGTQINAQAKQWIHAIRSAFHMRELTQEEQSYNQRFTQPSKS